MLTRESHNLSRESKSDQPQSRPLPVVLWLGVLPLTTDECENGYRRILQHRRNAVIVNATAWS